MLHIGYLSFASAEKYSQTREDFIDPFSTTVETIGAMLDAVADALLDAVEEALLEAALPTEFIELIILSSNEVQMILSPM